MFSNSPPGHVVLGRYWRAPHKQAIYHPLAIITLIQMTDGKMMRTSKHNNLPCMLKKEYIEQFSINLFAISKPKKRKIAPRLTAPSTRGIIDQWGEFHKRYQKMDNEEITKKCLSLTKRTAITNILDNGVLEKNHIATVVGDSIVINPVVERELRSDRTGWMDIFVHDLQINFQFWNQNWNFAESRDHIRKSLRWRQRRGSSTMRFKKRYEILKKKKQFSWVCVHCNKKSKSGKYQMDHLMSVRGYGERKAHVSPNIAPSCPDCNGSTNKSDSLLNKEGWESIERFFSKYPNIVTTIKSSKRDDEPEWSVFYNDVIEHYEGLDGVPAWGFISGMTVLSTQSINQITKTLETIRTM